MYRTALWIVLAGCASTLSTPLSSRVVPSVSWPTPGEVPALARAFYRSVGIIHATEDDPNAQDTPLLASLRPCQIEPARPLDHPGFQKFFPALRFFVSSCGDGSYAVVSIDKDRRVRLVSLEPHERLPASAWDDPTNGPIAIAGADDARLFGSAYGLLVFLQTASASVLTIHESSGTGPLATTHYYEIAAPTYNLTIGSEDKRHYSVASTGHL